MSTVPRTVARPVTVTSVSDESELRRAVAELLDAMLELHHLTIPAVGGSIVGGGNGGNDLGRETMPPALDAARGVWRAIERSEIRKIRGQAVSIRNRCRGDEIQGPRPWRCPGCNRWQRGAAKACDRCVPQVLRPEQPAPKR